eukprot:2344396-Pyramimonas_sp.AAC.1
MRLPRLQISRITPIGAPHKVFSMMVEVGCESVQRRSRTLLDCMTRLASMHTEWRMSTASRE